MFIFLLLVAMANAAVYGVDISQPISKTVADCFVSSGFVCANLKGGKEEVGADVFARPASNS